MNFAHVLTALLALPACLLANSSVGNIASGFTYQWNLALQTVTSSAGLFSVNLGPLGIQRHPELNPLTSADKTIACYAQLILNNKEKTFSFMFSQTAATNQADIKKATLLAGAAKTPTTLLALAQKFNRPAIIKLLS